MREGFKLKKNSLQPQKNKLGHFLVLDINFWGDFGLEICLIKLVHYETTINCKNYNHTAMPKNVTLSGLLILFSPKSYFTNFQNVSNLKLFGLLVPR